MKPCKIEGCPKPAGLPGTAYGWCSMHYTRWKRTGDPLTTLTDLKPKLDPQCSVDGCDWPRLAKGLCGTHYRRLMTTGEIGGAERQTEKRAACCDVPQCKRPVRTKRLCNAHYNRKLRYGDPLGGGSFFGAHDRCSARSCDRPHYAGGLCRQHWKIIQCDQVTRGMKLGLVIPGHCTVEQLIARIDMFGNRCWMCGGPADQIDHVKPLSAGGSNWPANLRPACGPCNMHKWARWPFDTHTSRAVAA